MRRLIFLTVPVVILVTLLTTVLAWEAERTPDWEIALNHYLIESRGLQEATRVERVVTARQPWHFTEDMGYPSLGDGWSWATADIPFPPRQMQCVLLERIHKENIETAAVSTRQVIFVTKHSDTLWRIGWLVHAGPREPFPLELMTQLEALGCDLGLW